MRGTCARHFVPNRKALQYLFKQAPVRLLNRPERCVVEGQFTGIDILETAKKTGEIMASHGKFDVELLNMRCSEQDTSNGTDAIICLYPEVLDQPPNVRILLPTEHIPKLTRRVVSNENNIPVQERLRNAFPLLVDEQSRM